MYAFQLLKCMCFVIAVSCFALITISTGVCIVHLPIVCFFGFTYWFQAKKIQNWKVLWFGLFCLNTYFIHFPKTTLQLFFWWNCLLSFSGLHEECWGLSSAFGIYQFLMSSLYQWCAGNQSMSFPACVMIWLLLWDKADNTG